MLGAIRRHDWAEAERIQNAFEPPEALRNPLSPVCMLQKAVAGAGLAATGPLLPLLDPVEERSPTDNHRRGPGPSCRPDLGWQRRG